jgi:hypothetical protein
MDYKLIGSPYPKLEKMEDIGINHLNFCQLINRPVRFSGDNDLQKMIESNQNVVDPKDRYMESIRERALKGKQVTHTKMRKVPSNREMINIFNLGFSDAQIADRLGFGRNRIATIRVSLGIAKKVHRNKIMGITCR